MSLALAKTPARQVSTHLLYLLSKCVKSSSQILDICLLGKCIRSYMVFGCSIFQETLDRVE